MSDKVSYNTNMRLQNQLFLSVSSTIFSIHIHYTIISHVYLSRNFAQIFNNFPSTCYFPSSLLISNTLTLDQLPLYYWKLNLILWAITIEIWIQHLLSFFIFHIILSDTQWRLNIIQFFLFILFFSTFTSNVTLILILSFCNTC